jgi:hypothetical protein
VRNFERAFCRVAFEIYLQMEVILPCPDTQLLLMTIRIV